MNSLVDTNIFLEILLNQSARQPCQDFLNDDPEAAWISCLHSIGVVLFRRGRVELFRQFIADTLPELTILTLSNAGYSEVIQAHSKFGLDFDDAYQLAVAKENSLAITTRDRDFERVRNEVPVTFV